MTSRRGRTAVVALLATALMTTAACGGDEPGGAAGTAAEGTTPTAPADGHPDHGGDDHGTSHSMGISPGTVSDVAALGPGPEVGDVWEIPFAVNVCGRFVQTSDDDAGIARVAPEDPSTAGANATVASQLEPRGVTLRTGELTLPDGVSPDVIPFGEGEVDVAGTTFRTGDTCGATPAEVQVWVYSADAVETGEGILTVTTDPDDVRIAEDGMAIVVAFTPESSLPTLPPSALDLG